MPIPPLNFIEPRDAIRLLRDAFGCSGEEAAQFLCDRWISGEITPHFIAGEPPAGVDPHIADWFAGEVRLPEKWLPRRAISEPGDDPEWQRIPGRSFPFKIVRPQLEAALKAARAGADLSEPTPTGLEPVPLLDAAEIIAKRLNISTQSALDAIVEAAATKRIKVYCKPESRFQGDRIRARVWRKVVRGEAQLSTDPTSGNSTGDKWSDPYVFRADLEGLIRELPCESATPESETAPAKPAADTTGDHQVSQSEKAKLRRRVKQFLEAEAEIDPPRAQRKADWHRLVRQEYADGVTDNLFDEVWREAKLPPAWRAPGRRT